MSKTVNEIDYKRLCKQLRVFGFNSYDDFLNSELWDAFRERMKIVKESTRCCICSKKKPLVLHHVKYTNLLDPDSVRFVCFDCHKDIHDNDFDGKIGMLNRTRRVSKKIKETTPSIEKPARTSFGHFVNWGDKTGEFLKEREVPDTVYLSLKSTFHQNPYKTTNEFFNYWLAVQEYQVGKDDTRTAKLAKYRLDWYKNHGVTAHELVYIWCSNFN